MADRVQEIENLTEEPKSYPSFWESLILFILYIVFTLLCGLLVRGIAMDLNSIQGFTLVYFGSLAPVISIGFYFKKKREKNFKWVFKISNPLILGLGIAITLLGLALSMDPLMKMIDTPESVTTLLGRITDQPFLAFLALVILPAILEELLFRGILLDGFSKRMGSWPAVILSSLLFGAIHGNWLQFIFASTLGLLLGIIYLKTNSILYPILIHGFNNALSYFMYLSGYESLQFQELVGSQTQYIILCVVSGIVTIFLGRSLVRVLDRNRNS